MKKKQSKLLARKLEEFGVSPNLVIVSNAPHAFHLTLVVENGVARLLGAAFIDAHADAQGFALRRLGSTQIEGGLLHRSGGDFGESS
jgi:hypothetical protein